MFYTKRIAASNETATILALINDGKQQMNAQGISQWDDSYPNKNVILQDIEKKQLWVYGSHCEACVTVQKTDHTSFIQRLVVNSHYQRSGIARFILTDIIQQAESEKQVDQLKISTNNSNSPMQHLLTSLNFIPSRKYRMPGREQFGNFLEFTYPIRICK